MATGRIESGRVDIRAPGSSPMQRVGVNEINFVGPRVAAQGAGQIAEALDRMSANLFQESFRQREKEGLQFAAENPPTPDQIEAAKNGRLEDMDLGANPVSVFQQAVRKSRALQLSQAFEMEGSQELVRMLELVKLGQADSEQILTKINTMTEGLGRTLSKIDPDAAYKFRASMATSGNAVYREAVQAQIKRAQEQALIKVDENFRNRRDILQAAANADPINFDLVHAPTFLADITRSAQALSSPALQSQYSQQAREAIKNAKIGVIASKLNTPENANTNPMAVLDRIRKGELGTHSPLLKSFLEGPGKDDAAIQQIEKQFMEYVGNHIRLRDDAAKLDKTNRENKGNDLLIEYYRPNTPTSRKTAIANELAGLRILSIEQLEKFLDPKAKAADGYVVGALENKIMLGEITEPEELKRLSARAGLSGEQYLRLNSQLRQGFDRDQAEARKFLNRVAGVPDVQSVFASKDDEHKIAKGDKLVGIWKDKIETFRKSNPGVAIPYSLLAREAAQNYNDTDRADATKTRARNELNNFVTELVSKKRVQQGFVIDENTDVDALVRQGILKSTAKDDQADYVRRRIQILREVAR